MSEEKIIETLTNYNLVNHFNNTEFFEALKCLLNMYNQEKEKNKELKIQVDYLNFWFTNKFKEIKNKMKLIKIYYLKKMKLMKRLYKIL